MTSPVPRLARSSEGVFYSRPTSHSGSTWTFFTKVECLPSVGRGLCNPSSFWPPVNDPVDLVSATFWGSRLYLRIVSSTRSRTWFGYFIHLVLLLPSTMEGGDDNLFLPAEHFLVQIAAIIVGEQPDNLFRLVSFLRGKRGQNQSNLFDCLESQNRFIGYHRLVRSLAWVVSPGVGLGMERNDPVFIPVIVEPEIMNGSVKPGLGGGHGGVVSVKLEKGLLNEILGHFFPVHKVTGVSEQRDFKLLEQVRQGRSFVFITSLRIQHGFHLGFIGSPHASDMISAFVAR